MRVVDLFCGGGGFSLGAHNAGIPVVAAFDVNSTLTSSFEHNFPKTALHLTDISKLTGSTIEAAIGGKVDGVFGGPPCQGFSDIGRRAVDDPRRDLLLDFFRLVAELKPAFFVMENVRGLAYEDARGVLDLALGKVAGRYDLIGPVILDAAQFGAATRRRRLFVIGLDPTRCDPLTLEDIGLQKCPPATVRQAIGDLEGAVQQQDVGKFDQWKITKPGRPSDYARALRSSERTFTGHRATVHTEDVIKRFAAVLPGKVDTVGRHPRLDWAGQCPTLRAGTGSDKGSYQAVRPIHPDEPRVITVREAARLQGFPDAFQFHPTVWHSFRMIGNSVSPIISKTIFSLIADRIEVATPLSDAAE